MWILMVLSDGNIPKLPKSLQLHFGFHLMGINHTNTIFIDPTLIQAPGAYSGKYGILITHTVFI